MKKILFILSILTLVSCAKKEGCTDSAALNFDPDAEKENNSCSYRGNLQFWTSNNWGENIFVTVNGSTSLITSYYSGVPSCDNSGCANFDLAPGVFYYSAETVSGSLIWSGSAEVTSNGCTNIKLQ
jgi:hypothetical protein